MESRNSLAAMCPITSDPSTACSTSRDTFARNFLLNGGDLLTLQRILGHSSLEVVKLYVNLDTKDLLSQQWKYSPVDTLRASHTV